MTEYVHIALPKNVAEVIDARAKQDYLTRSDVARQYLMRALIDESVVSLRKRKYSIRAIAEALNVPTIKVYDALARTQIDEQLYPDDSEEDQRTLEKLVEKNRKTKR